MSPTPTALPTLPNCLADGLSKQDDETLRDAREYIDELLATREYQREQPVTEDELPDDAEVVDEALNGTVYIATLRT